MKIRSDTKEPSAFLEEARPFRGENRFILGTFERGVTFYRQQVRALNLVYSFVEAKDSDGTPKIPPGSRIAVIGGGAFGTTVAAAAAYAGFRVVLLEKHQALLHLQRGCDTRWLHPRFYDWPAAVSESTLARLPVLDWPASTAAQVALEIERRFVELSEELKGRLTYVLNAVVDIRPIQANTYEVCYQAQADSNQNIVPSDVIIYAVGFGVEPGGKSESYWRNDRLGQTELEFSGNKIKYVVSGFGDGGLVDTFRLTIRDFKYEHIFSEMFGRSDDDIYKALNEIALAPNSEPGWLFDRFNALETGPHKAALRKASNILSQKRRSDTQVMLNGTAASFRLGLTVNSMSFSNALLAYLLFRIDAVTYHSGRLDVTDPEKINIEGVEKSASQPIWLQGAKTIVRHGTRREDALRAAGCGEAIDFLKKKSEGNSGNPIYPSGWWGRYTDPEDSVSAKSTPAPVEHVPPVLMTYATTFVSTLASILQHLIDVKSSSERNFRVALHRLVRIDGKDVYQQITPYQGRVEKTSGMGRFFPVHAGIVGLACRSGSLVVARKTDPNEFAKIWELTNLQDGAAMPIKAYVGSLLCCPFFYPDREDQSQCVALALFADSAHSEFFDDDIQGTISSACRGFVGLLEDLQRRGALRELPGTPSGYRVMPRTDLDGTISVLKELGVKFVDARDKGWKDGLTFKELKSLDLEVGYSLKARVR